MGGEWQAQPPAMAKIYCPLATSSLLSVWARAAPELETKSPSAADSKMIVVPKRVSGYMTLARRPLANFFVQVFERAVKDLIDRRFLAGLPQ